MSRGTRAYKHLGPNQRSALRQIVWLLLQPGRGQFLPQHSRDSSLIAAKSHPTRASAHTDAPVSQTVVAAGLPVEHRAERAGNASLLLLDVLIGLLFELRLAIRRAKVIGFSFLHSRCSGLLFIDVHSANWIFRHFRRLLFKIS